MLKISFLSSEIVIFLKLKKKSLCIAWACFRNGLKAHNIMQNAIRDTNWDTFPISFSLKRNLLLR